MLSSSYSFICYYCYDNYYYNSYDKFYSDYRLIASCLNEEGCLKLLLLLLFFVEVIPFIEGALVKAKPDEEEDCYY